MRLSRKKVKNQKSGEPKREMWEVSAFHSYEVEDVIRKEDEKENTTPLKMVEVFQEGH